MNNKRKNRQGPPRSPRGRVVAEGVYNNAHFMHAATTHVGDTVQVLTQSGCLWEGVFKTFSAQFEVVLEVAHRVDQDGVVAVESVVDKLIFKPQDVVSIRAKDSDLEYATHDVFQTDSVISSKFNGNGRSAEERHLEPWDGCDGDSGDTPALNGDSRLEELELDHRANGWDANDMFRKNEEVYGVLSTYDNSLLGYTVPLQKKDTQDYRDAEAKAEEIAAEIESTPAYKTRIEVENGDEEERFAAVVRPGDAAPGKYVIPNKRKNMQTGKLVKPNNGGSSPSANKPPPSYPAPPAHPPHAPHPPHQHKDVRPDKDHRPPRPHLTPPADRRPDSQPPPLPSSNPPNSNPPPQKSYSAQAAGYHTFPHHHVHHPHSYNLHPASAGAGSSPANKLNGPHVRHPPPPHHHNPPPPPVVEAHRHHAPPEPRRQDEVQELRRFGQEFKLVTAAPQPQSPPNAHAPVQPAPSASPPEVSANAGSEPHKREPRPPKQNTPPHHMPPPPHHHKPPTGPSSGSPPAAAATPQPPQPPQPPPSAGSAPASSSSSPSASPPAAVSPGVSATLKKSTLNPNAKEFNPAAKPFTPRSPSTPNPSRPHTPGTPVSGVVGMGVGGVGVGLGGVGVMGTGVSYVPAPHPPPPHMMAAVPTYMVPAQQPPSYLQHPALAYGAMGGGAGVAGGAGQHGPLQAQQQRNFRKMGVGSGVGVAAATGQPLLAPAPMQPFVPYPHPHPPHPAQQHIQYQHMVRMYGGGVPGVGGVPGGVGAGSGEVGSVGYAAPPAPSPAAASPALYPPPSPAHTPHPHQHPHSHPHPHHHYQQPAPFQVLCPLMAAPGSAGAHHHLHHHAVYHNHPNTASPPQHHHIQQVLLPGQASGGTPPGAHGPHP
ncbi:ataxin-2-like protein isoform X2 [Plodia interpunctella]|uniref:ataxin-2-like protein isoform X2 n=1 Tax=Plodia interpunctella TaxID=58824 RepID=UPI0023683FC0|nr:ataxin-2-like protein isoform X2 [Plodia interpunctella]